MADSSGAGERSIRLRDSDGLLVADMQRDFVTGSLAVRDAVAIIPVLNRYLREFTRRMLPVIATRDWHPTGHCSFRSQGGPWPPHCIAGTPGAAFVEGLAIGPDAIVISKAVDPGHEAYSAFDGTGLEPRLHGLRIHRLFIGGLTTDYCVRATVHDALRLRYPVFLLTDAIRAVDVKPGDGDRAVAEMIAEGAEPIRIADLESREKLHG